MFNLFVFPGVNSRIDLSVQLGKVSKTPGTETFRWGGTPPPGPPRTRIFRKVSGKKLTEKGGTPPPLTDNPFPKTPLHGRSVPENLTEKS